MAKTTRVLMLLGSVLLASLAQAQTTCVAPGPCTIAPGQTYSVGFDYVQGTGTFAAQGFRVYVNGSKQGNDIPIASLVGGSVTQPGFIAQSRGTYTIEVAAFNADGEGPKSAPLTLASKTPPTGPPTNLRIIIAVSVASDGTIKFEYRGVEAEPVK